MGLASCVVLTRFFLKKESYLKLVLYMLTKKKVSFIYSSIVEDIRVDMNKSFTP